MAMAPGKNSPQLSNYGSIAVRNYDVEEPTDLTNRSTSRKTSTFALVVSVFVLASAAVLIHNENHKSTSQIFDGPPKAILDNTEILGEVHRRPEDTPHWFSQRRDHFDDFRYADTWQQRYFRKSEFWKGPGHPIFLIVGGEGGIDRGMFYPFVDTYLAKRYGAYVLHPEHRFYGESQPVGPGSLTNDDLKKYLTTRQAILDMLSIVKAYREHLGCSTDKKSKDYCPVITVGGSYPGFLSALMRLHYPDIVDIGYASSAPLKLYAMEADQYGYFDIVSEVADKASPGCQEAVRKTLYEVDEAIRATDDHVKFAHDTLNVCPGTLPNYIKNNDVLSKEVMMIVEYSFADANMFFYPPGKRFTYLDELCEVFQDDSKDSFGIMAEFWKHLEENVSPTLECFDMTSQLPDGPKAQISGSDWSGTGIGYDGMMFDFHCCATLTPPVGFSKESMFPHRKWTLEELTEHCVDRFDVVPDPYKLVREFKFDDLVGQGATKILFTNGMNDLWSAGSYLEPLSHELPVINILNSAHHSDLTYSPKSHRDIEEVDKAHKEITAIFDGWLHDIRKKQK